MSQLKLYNRMKKTKFHYLISPAVQQQERSIKGGLVRYAAFPGAGGLDKREVPSGESFTSGPGPGGPTPGGDQDRHPARDNWT